MTREFYWRVAKLTYRGWRQLPRLLILRRLTCVPRSEWHERHHRNGFPGTCGPPVWFRSLPIRSYGLHGMSS
jgi:hypothetical protein